MKKTANFSLELIKHKDYYIALENFWQLVLSNLQPDYNLMDLKFSGQMINPYIPSVESFNKAIQNEIYIDVRDASDYLNTLLIDQRPKELVDIRLGTTQLDPKLLVYFFLEIAINICGIVWIDCGHNSIVREKYIALGEQFNLHARSYHLFFWLNFLNHEEAARHGGDVLLELPFATRTEKLETGIFIQIGDSPEDVHTAEGKERLCRAMHWVYGLISLGRPLTQSEMDAFEMPPEIEYVAPNVLPHEELPPGIKAIFNSASSFDDEEEEDTP